MKLYLKKLHFPSEIILSFKDDNEKTLGNKSEDDKTRIYL